MRVRYKQSILFLENDMGRNPNIPIAMPGENVVTNFGASASSSDQQVRKYFPETFIWMDGQSG